MFEVRTLFAHFSRPWVSYQYGQSMLEAHKTWQRICDKAKNMTFLSNNMGISIGNMKEQRKEHCQLQIVISKVWQKFPTNFSLPKFSKFPCQKKKKPRKNQEKTKKKIKKKNLSSQKYGCTQKIDSSVCVCVHARVWGFLMQGWVSYTLPFRIHFGVWVWLILSSVMTRN